MFYARLSQRLFLSPADFLMDVRSLRKRYDPSIPILVHCSAGVGRSGVVLLVDQLMAKVDSGEVNEYMYMHVHAHTQTYWYMTQMLSPLTSMLGAVEYCGMSLSIEVVTGRDHEGMQRLAM